MVKRHTQSSKKHTSTNKTTTAVGIVVGLVIVGLIVFGIYTLVNRETVDLSVYNGFAFERRPSGQQVYWITQVQLAGEIYEVPFYHHPTELEAYEYDERITNYILKHPFQEIVLAVHPEAGSIPVLAGVNIGRVTGKFYGVPTSSALFIPEGYEHNATGLPEVNCKNATSTRPIIWLSNSTSEPSVVLSDEEEYCIYVSGEDKNILAAADLFAYKILGIMA